MQSPVRSCWKIFALNSLQEVVVGSRKTSWLFCQRALFCFNWNNPSWLMAYRLSVSWLLSITWKYLRLIFILTDLYSSWKFWWSAATSASRHQCGNQCYLILQDSCQNNWKSRWQRLETTDLFWWVMEKLLFSIEPFVCKLQDIPWCSCIIQYSLDDVRFKMDCLLRLMERTCWSLLGMCGS